MAQKKEKGFIAKTITFIIDLAIITVLGMILLAFIYEFTDKSLRKESIPNFQESQYFYADSLSDKNAEKIKNFIESQPEGVKNQFDQQHWCLLFSPYAPSRLINSTTFDSSGVYNESAYSVMSGIVVSKPKIIYVNSDLQNDEAVFNAFTHEFGHYIDYVYGYPSMSKEFKALYQANEGCSIFNEYESSSSIEYFATAFGKYNTDPGELLTQAPDVYAYFDSLKRSEVPYDNLLSRLVHDDIGMLRLLRLNLSTLLE